MLCLRLHINGDTDVLAYSDLAYSDILATVTLEAGLKLWFY